MEHIRIRTAQHFPGGAAALVLFAVAAMLLSGCSYVPNWASPVAWYDQLFTDEGGGFVAAPDQPGGFPAVADVPLEAPPPLNPVAQAELAEALAGDRDNALYIEEQLRQGGVPEGAVVVAAAPAPVPAPPAPAPPAPAVVPVPAPVVAEAPAALEPSPPPAPPAVPVGVVEAVPLPDLGVPEMAMPLPPEAAARGLAIIAEAAPLPDLGAGLTPLPPAGPALAGPALAQPLPALVPILPAPPAVAVAPALAAADPVPVPAAPGPVAPGPVAPQFAAAPVAAAAPALPAPTLQQVAQVLPPASAAGQDTLAAVYAQMLQQSQATVTIVPPLAGFPSAPAPAIALPAFFGGGAPDLGAPAGPAAEAAPTIVFFRHDSAALSAEAKRQIGQIAAAYKEEGGRIRVVGHASQRTKDMPVEKHMLVNFRVSANRAGAVAKELMRLGVDPLALTIDAVGDAQPAFLEAMPAGETGNRRVEIFVEA